MAGRGSLAGLLAYGNANEIVVEMAHEVLPVVRHTPVLAGVNGTDPFMLMPQFLRQLADLGFSGVQNFPSVGLIDGTFRANLEETGMGYALEVDMIRAARALDLLTTPYVFSENDAREMARAGADIIVCHLGLTTGGAIGAGTALTLEDCVPRINAWSAAAREVNPDVIVLCHGGPIATPEDAEIDPAAVPAMPRLLRRIEHGAAADRNCADTTDQKRFVAINRDKSENFEKQEFAREYVMSGTDFGIFILSLLTAAIVVAVIVSLFHWLYLRSSKERSFVRTGLGGQKVVLGGGAFVLPIVHDVIPVNMNTLRLEVARGRDKALITKDRMRVDVISEFYVRVKADANAVADAAQTLGMRTLEPERLKELLEGKFVDALRTAAAEMTMEELHEKRGDFVKRVRQVVAEDLRKNGLELEAASLTQLDQTAMEFFNPSNAFDAEGLTRLTEQIERRKKQRNDVEQDTMISIRSKNLEAEKLSLDIDREAEYARLTQEREVEVARAQQRTELARERSTSEREVETSQISAREAIEKARIATDRVLEEERISKEGGLQAREIERRKT